MPTIYLARHATPDWTRTDIPYFTPPGPPLAAHGPLEAAALGAFLRPAGVLSIASSPLVRCHATAAIVGEVLGLPVHVENALAEWQPGEDAAVVAKRMWSAFQNAWDATAGEDGRAALLLTHGGPIKALLRHCGMDDQTIDQRSSFDHQNLVPPAGAWKISRAPGTQVWEMSLAFVPEVA